MDANALELKANLKNKGVVLDTNMLLLFYLRFIGLKHLSSFKRTSGFIEEDYYTLIDLLEFSPIYATPSIFTEASNLIEGYNHDEGLHKLGDMITVLPEIHNSSRTLIKQPTFAKLGLTDSSIYYLCNLGFTSITIDFKLYGFLVNNKLSVINFNHLRSAYLLK